MSYSSENGILLYKELRHTLGGDAAIKVFRILAKRQVYFPEGVLKEFRNRAILEDYREGMSYGKLAQKYNLTQKHIRNITAPPRAVQAKPSQAKPSQAADERSPGYLF